MVTTRRQFVATTGGLAGVALLAACGLSERRPGAESPDRLVVNMSGGIAVLDAGRREVVVPVKPPGPIGHACSPPGRMVWGPNCERSTSTGTELARALAPGSLTARVVAPSGHLGFRPAAGRRLRASPARQTAIVVADPAGELPPRRLELAGNYEPEAFDTDDQ
jgi:hypothetical protein